MEDIVLGKQQEDAIRSIIDFIENSKDLDFGLFGFAGTGKSTIIKKLVEYLKKNFIDYVIMAPTHKARAMVMYNSGLEAFTIHQMLSLFPNVEIKNLDLRDLDFIKKTKYSRLPYGGVIICDEASMVNDVLYEYLLKETKSQKSKIIFVGDEAQLKPVKSNEKSFVFSVKNQVTLTDIYRQSNNSGILETLSILRTKSLPSFEESKKIDGSILIYKDIKSLFVSALPIFKESIKNEDIFNSKFLAYTNFRTDALNNKIRQFLFPGNNLFNVGEILTFYDNFSYNNFNFWNSMDYVVKEISPLETKFIKNFGNITGYTLFLKDYLENINMPIFVIDPNIPKNIIKELAYKIESIRNSALEYKYIDKKKSAAYWKDYYELFNSFAVMEDLYCDNRVVKKATFKYGYATTIHKS